MAVRAENPTPRSPVTPASSGPRLLGGFSWIRAEFVGYRADVGFQIGGTGPIAWRVLASALYHHESVEVPSVGGLMGGDISVHELALFASGEIDVGVLSSEHGRLGVGGGFGVGPAFLWLKLPDMPYTPAEWTTDRTVVARISGHVEYRFGNGVVLYGQPIGVLISGQEDSDPGYETSILGGYQW